MTSTTAVPPQMPSFVKSLDFYLNETITKWAENELKNITSNFQSRLEKEIKSIAAEAAIQIQHVCNWRMMGQEIQLTIKFPNSMKKEL